MTPDYGDHAPFILAAWGLSVLALGVLVARTVLSARRAERRSAEGDPSE